MPDLLPSEDVRAGRWTSLGSRIKGVSAVSQPAASTELEADNQGQYNLATLQAFVRSSKALKQIDEESLRYKQGTAYLPITNSEELTKVLASGRSKDFY